METVTVSPGGGGLASAAAWHTSSAAQRCAKPIILPIILLCGERAFEHCSFLPGGLEWLPMNRRSLLSAALGAFVRPAAHIPAKTVVLTFDDAVKSHRAFVAPLLNDLGFRATFFVTHRWMDDRENFMTWRDIAEIQQMGFEIGNHSWTHGNFSTPQSAARLVRELAQVETELSGAGVPRPVSFAWCGNAFGPEALQVLRDRGFQFARRGMQPEAEYGTLQF